MPIPKLAVFPKGFFNDLCERRMPLPRWIELASTLGVDGLELYPRFLESFETPYLRQLRRDIEARGLRVPMMCNSPDFTQPDPAARAGEVARTRLMLDVTAELGAGYCRVLSGQARPGLDEGEALRWVADCLRELVPHAQATGVVMVIENHYKDGLWQYPEFAQGTRRYLAVLESVQSPWLRAQYDPSNAIVAGDDQYDLLERVLPRLATMQASDRYLDGGSIAELRGMAADPQHGYAKFVKHGVIGRGLNDYDRIFSTMARAGYEGWVSIEDGEGETEAIGMSNLRASVEFLRGKLGQHFGGARGGA